MSDTRIYDALNAIGTFIDVVMMTFELNALLNPLMWILNFLLSWVLLVFNLLKTALVVAEPIMWVNSPLKWIPVPNPEADSA